MFRLDELAPLKKKRKTVGRGGSRGGTSGRGHKGQKARSGGKIDSGFEGGQMPLYRRLPKRGFNNVRFAQEVKIINLDALNNIDAEQITKELLIEKGIIKSHKKKPFLLKVLAKGIVDKPLTVVADLFSESAQKAIEQAGGKAITKKE